MSLYLRSNNLGSAPFWEEHVGHGENHGNSLAEGIYGNSDFFNFLFFLFFFAEERATSIQNTRNI